MSGPGLSVAHALYPLALPTLQGSSYYFPSSPQDEFHIPVSQIQSKCLFYTAGKETETKDLIVASCRTNENSDA